MIYFLTKKIYLLFYIAIIFVVTNAEPPLREVSLNLQPPSLQSQVVKLVQSHDQRQQQSSDPNAYLVNYFVDNQNQQIQLELPANSYVVANTGGADDQSYQVERKKPPTYTSKTSKPFTLTVTNVTKDLIGKLTLPYGLRLSMALTYPSKEESSYPKTNQNSYGQPSYYGNQNNVQFQGEPAINFGNIVSDTFVLKERKAALESSSGTSAPPVSGNSNDRASILNGILSTIIENGPSPRPTNDSSQSQTPQESETEEIHLPGDLIAREIPLNGEINFGSLDNLTEFLIEDGSKSRPSRRQLNSMREQVPMFVAVQYYTVGRNKVRTYEQGAEKNSRIHVVLGHKHFSYKNIKNLNELYDYVNEDYETYQPSGDYGSNYFNAKPKFRVSKCTIDLIIEFVHFSWRAHQDTHTATEARGKAISKRLAKLLSQSTKNKPRFRPNKSQEETPVDFFTWAYTNTIGYRTLV